MAASAAPVSIADVEAVQIVVPLDTGFPTSHFTLTHKACLFARVRLVDGVVGEAYSELGSPSAVTAVAAMVEQDIRPALLGRDVRDFESLWEVARIATREHSPRLDWVERSARGVVDAAVWDAIGKVLEQPLWRLWGGYRNSVQTVWIGGYYGSDIATEVEAMLGVGTAGVKFKVGGLSPTEDAERVALARKVGGADFVLLADANCGWELADALEFAQLVADQQVRWFEEPCGRTNASTTWRDVRLFGRIPVCGGQTELSAAECLSLMVAEAIDVCNIDSLWAAGPTEWRRAAAGAAALDRLMAHHQQPCTAAHLLASIPHGTYVEIYTPERDPIWWNAIANRPELSEGEMTLPAEPGYGWQYDWEWLDRYRVASDIGGGTPAAA